MTALSLRLPAQDLFPCHRFFPISSLTGHRCFWVRSWQASRASRQSVSLASLASSLRRSHNLVYLLCHSRTVMADTSAGACVPSAGESERLTGLVTLRHKILLSA